MLGPQTMGFSEIDLVHQLLRLNRQRSLKIRIAHHADLILQGANNESVGVDELLVHTEIIAHPPQIHLTFSHL